MQPFDMSRSDGVSMTSLVMPFDDEMEKHRKNVIQSVRFGQIKGWAISRYKDGTSVIWLSTEVADCKCVKPTTSYGSYFDQFSLKARVCVEVYRKLARSVGKNPLLCLEELLTNIVRFI